uniref:Uncharacterized protein n=1 Tax=Sipha flava TaxID=143950 RepID=A0A2S2R335_9HEMI
MPKDIVHACFRPPATPSKRFLVRFSVTCTAQQWLTTDHPSVPIASAIPQLFRILLSTPFRKRVRRCGKTGGRARCGSPGLETGCDRRTLRSKWIAIDGSEMARARSERSASGV